jgi:hypothetical protein
MYQNRGGGGGTCERWNFSRRTLLHKFNLVGKDFLINVSKACSFVRNCLVLSHSGLKSNTSHIVYCC